MKIVVTFTCGHRTDVGLNDAAPVCRVCGETRVARSSAPPPRFRGACSGPYAETAHLDPAVVDLTTTGPLKLKEIA